MLSSGAQLLKRLNPFAPTRLPPAFHFTLRDGRLALVRWVHPADRERFVAGFRMLSEQSRQRRFFTPVSELSEKQLRYFTEIDYVNHMAWGAIDPAQPELPGLGVARYIRLTQDPSQAEVAITVADDFHNTGVGTVLYAALNLSAAEQGIRTFCFDVLEENTAFIQRLKALGGRSRGTARNIVSLDVPVYGRPYQVPAGTESGKVFREVLEQLTRVRPVMVA